MARMGARPSAVLESFSGREGLLLIDKDSPPGAWKEEMARAPWAFGQKARTVEQALITLRQAGYWDEATLLAQEISLMKAEIYQLKAQKDTAHVRLAGA